MRRPGDRRAEGPAGPNRPARQNGRLAAVLRSPSQARLLPVIAGAVAIMLVAGAAAAHTQASADPPGLFGMIAALLGCNEAFEAALMARDALDEAEFHALLDASAGPGP